MPKLKSGPSTASQRDRAGGSSQYRKALPIEPLCLRIPAASEFVGISRSKLYELIATGEVETLKLGAATLVLTESLRALVEARRGRG